MTPRAEQERLRVAGLEFDWAMAAPRVGVTFDRKRLSARRYLRLRARATRGYKLRAGYTRRGSRPTTMPEPVQAVVPLAPRRKLRERARVLFRRAMRQAA